MSNEVLNDHASDQRRTGAQVAIVTAYTAVMNGENVAFAQGGGIRVLMARDTLPRVGPSVMKLPMGDWDEKEMAGRLARVVHGDPGFEPQPPRDGGGTWQLDAGNNWKFHAEGDQFVLQARYGWPEDEWHGLKASIVRLLNLNKEDA